MRIALRVLPLVGLVCSVLAQPAAAQHELVQSRTFLVNVTQGPLRPDFDRGNIS